MREGGASLVDPQPHDVALCAHPDLTPEQVPEAAGREPDLTGQVEQRLSRIAGSAQASHSLPGSQIVAMLTGALLFLPIGVLMLHRDFAVEARATFWRNATLLQQVDLATTARMSAPVVRDRKRAEKALPEAMFRQLAEQLAVRLVPVSAWLGSLLVAHDQRTRRW